MEDIRWKQRFSNLEKAFLKLNRAVHLFNFDDFIKYREEHNSDFDSELERLELEREGLIQRFEYTYELFIQTLRDLLIENGALVEEVNGSRKTLQKALVDGYIIDHDGWRDMVVSRNEKSHSYDEESADEITQKIIHAYFPLMRALFQRLQNEHTK